MRKVRESPNVLFISTDQQTWDAVSAYGNPHVNTPNIDRLVEHGVSFMRSYCTDPVCAAARASWMTGLYTSENGVPFNGGLMHDDIPDLGQILEQDGIPA
ncbi:MAG: sulfatase-like hydrolase/transferase, partial [Deinococcales bacterium]|nr:sulfatase-like hydrolase/transferase [Deinococcales bacterium]